MLIVYTGQSFFFCARDHSFPVFFCGVALLFGLRMCRIYVYIRIRACAAGVLSWPALTAHQGGGEAAVFLLVVEAAVSTLVYHK